VVAGLGDRYAFANGFNYSGTFVSEQVRQVGIGSGAFHFFELFSAESAVVDSHKKLACDGGGYFEFFD
jgi:hypothetical protein